MPAVDRSPYTPKPRNLLRGEQHPSDQPKLLAPPVLPAPRLLSRLAIVLPAIIPSILAVAFDGTPPTEAALKAELSLLAAATSAGLVASTPPRRQSREQN